MSIKVKKNASIIGCGAEILMAAIKCEPLFAKLKLDLVITSGAERYEHTAIRSAHYRGDALDWRTRHLPEDKRPGVVNNIKKRLGPNYVVIWENKGKASEHIHVHWSPVFS